jgi:hypothetical protein
MVNKGGTSSYYVGLDLKMTIRSFRRLLCNRSIEGFCLTICCKIEGNRNFTMEELWFYVIIGRH